MAQNQYISKTKFDILLKDLNYDSCEESQKQDLLDRATGDLEADLSKKFYVPLVSVAGGAYTTCQSFAQNKVLNAMKAKIREIIGYDKNRNLTGTIESTQKFLNVHGIEYKDQMKGILDPLIVYGFKVLGQAENAQTPIQSLSLSKANNRTDPYGDDNGGGGVLY